MEAGAFAGVLGGILMALFLMCVGVAIHGDFFAPMRMFGLFFEDSNALLRGAGAVVWGFSLHLTLSAFLGIVFASGTARLPYRISVVAGVVYGLVLFLVLTYLVLPWANHTMYTFVHQMMLAWISAHVIFGLFVALGGPLSGRWESHFEKAYQ